MVHHLVRRALGDDLPAMHAGARADVDHVVGEADGVLVVLHHDHRVADIAQVGEGGQQTLVVALVQADGRLVEDVHDAHQAGADLAGQADALRLAAGQGVGAAVEGQVVEADVDQELQALADFLEDLRRDLAAAAGQAEAGGVFAGGADRHRGDRRQGPVADPHVARLAAQAGAVAVRAGLGAEELGQLLTHGGRFGLAVAALQVRQDALERVRALDDVAAVVEVAEVDVLPARAEQHGLLVLGGQLVERLLQAEAVVLGQRAEHLEVVDVAPVPAADRAFGQGQLAVDHPPRVEELLHAEAIAGRAGAGRVVEGEQLGFQLADRVAADRAGEARGEDDFLDGFLAVHRSDQGDAIGQIDRRLEGFGQALLQVGADLEAVHHHVDGMLLLLVELGQLVQFVELAVDPCADEALGAQLVEHRQVLALALADDRCEQHQLAALGQRQHLVDHLADGLRLQRDVVVRAARDADAGVEQAQVVVDLGDGADRRTRVVRGRLLFDGDRRRQAFDGVDVGLFHHRQELPGVGREGFHVAPLALGVEGVESQG
ncbi:hypothetical protein D3C76_447210 [compost metagenome]